MSPATEKEKEFMKDKNYRSLIGALLYFRLTRPDVLQPVLECAKFCQDPRPQHWKAAIRILRYLSGTKDYGLKMQSSGRSLQDEWDIEMYVDADHANCPDTRRSRRGHLIFLNKNLVAFTSKMETRVAMSTPMAEYIALSEAAKDAIWMRNVLKGMGVRVKVPIQIYEDNQTCQTLAVEPRAAKRTRHCDIRYHWIREHIQAGEIAVQWIPTTDMLADLMTKAVGRTLLERYRRSLMHQIVSPRDPTDISEATQQTLLKGDPSQGIAFTTTVGNNLQLQHGGMIWTWLSAFRH